MHIFIIRTDRQGPADLRATAREGPGPHARYTRASYGVYG